MTAAAIDGKVLALAFILLGVAIAYLVVRKSPNFEPEQIEPAIEETVPLEERCSRIHPTPCNRRAVMALGPYQWCEQDMPERLRDGHSDEVFDQEATA